MNAQLNIPLIKTVSEQLTDMLGEDFDPEAFWDSLDGETDAVDLIDRLLSGRQDAKALADAIKAQADQLSARRKRLEERAKAFDKTLLSILDATGQKKVERPQATVSRRTGSLSVLIRDEADIPSQLCKLTVSPDKTAIKKQLQEGEEVPGAELVRGDDGVTVRVI